MKNKKSPLNAILLTLAVIFVLFFLVMIIYSASKAGTGFDEKTSMDWIELVIIPITLALAVYLLNRYEKERESERTTDQKREDALQHYFDQVIELIRNNKDLSEEDLKAIKIRTLTVLRMLDGVRKGFIVKFLFENGLIANRRITKKDSQNKEKAAVKSPQLSLAGADLSYIHLQGESFVVREVTNDTNTVWELDLSGTNLEGANLADVQMWSANLSRARLNNANLTNGEFRFGEFNNTDFSNANLERAWLSGGNFIGAKFKKAKCNNTSFAYSTFFATTYPNNGSPFIDLADFTDAYLKYTSFDNANILPDQLIKAKVLWKIWLPRSGIYSGYHPLFTLVTSNDPQGAHWRESASVHSGLCGCKEMLVVDNQKVIEENSQTTDILGEQVYIDTDKDVLLALWSKYGTHRLEVYARNYFTKLLYIFLEYYPSSIPTGNYFQKITRLLSNGISFWKRYKETEGFTKNLWSKPVDNG